MHKFARSSARVAASLCAALSLTAAAQSPGAPGTAPRATLFENVRIFDGVTDGLSAPSNVLVVGRTIRAISTATIDTPEVAAATRIAGGGRTLMPGLIDAHTHMAFATVPQTTALLADVGFLNIVAARNAHETLLRGFTSVRDMGGPVFGLKQAIDAGVSPGPRIWPAGAFISQTGGHGDFRLPNEFPALPGSVSHAERNGASVIADSADAVRRAAREQLARGASHIKLMAGGGVSSPYDPLDVTQYTVDELRAAVEAAENWGTYVTVHAYTPRAVRQAIDAGVKCIEHGQLLDEATVKLMAERGIWWSLQVFLDDEDAIPASAANEPKRLTLVAGTPNVWPLARKHGVKVAWGTDTLFDAKLATRQGAQLVKVGRWFTPFEVLRMATSANGEVLALSGARHPYLGGALGVVREGALADLLLVDGNPLVDLELLADPQRRFVVVMKDGTVYKNTTR
jgi:imidazolonepropionase-like amidohydrolase